MYLSEALNKYSETFIPNKKLNVGNLTKEEFSGMILEYLKNQSNVSNTNLKENIRLFVIHFMFYTTNANVFFGYVDKYTGPEFNLELELAISYTMLEMITDYYISETEIC